MLARRNCAAVERATEFRALFVLEQPPQPRRLAPKTRALNFNCGI